MRIMIDYQDFPGEHKELLVIAEEFTIPGVEGHQFAVHNNVTCPALYHATHVETGMYVGRGDTPDEAIESARTNWLTCPPDQLAEKLSRARFLASTRNKQ